MIMTILDWIEVAGLGVAVVGCLYYVISVAFDYFLSSMKDTEK